MVSVTFWRPTFWNLALPGRLFSPFNLILLIYYNQHLFWDLSLNKEGLITLSSNTCDICHKI